MVMVYQSHSADLSSLSTEPPRAFKVCFDFSCKNAQQVSLTRQEWRKVTGIFFLNGSAAEERQRLKEAVAAMERLVGNYTPTYRDVGRNWPQDEELGSQSGQMDCIDESINTTTYLRLIEQAGLLKFHKVHDRAYRKSLFVQHWAAKIEELETGQTYVIDSWFEDNGELPVLVKA